MIDYCNCWFLKTLFVCNLACAVDLGIQIFYCFNLREFDLPSFLCSKNIGKTASIFISLLSVLFVYL